jgi:peptidoglycan/LPS O-acetylase OafA/YrhL
MREPSQRDRPSPEATAAQRRAWTRERTRDAARLLPVLGLALFLLPDLVLSGSPAAQGATLPWGVALLVIWVLLVVSALLISRAVRRQEADGEDAPPPR